MADDEDGKVKNTVKKAVGKAKEKVGDIVDNRRLEAEGRREQVEAELSERTRKAKKSVKDTAEKVRERVEEGTDEVEDDIDDRY
jgi:uncharacterized protein YjbJ (UPF0337 family)